jgi:hypothetical protein
MTKNELTIRLTEPVVFVPRATGTGREPSMVRGHLTLALSKPMRISSISLELQATLSVYVPGPNPYYSVSKLFSASTVFFRSHSGVSIHHPLSIGPGGGDVEISRDGWEEFKEGENVPRLHVICVE